MKLYVYVLEGSDLHVNKKSCYVKLQVGKHKSKTKPVAFSSSSSSSVVAWNEEFVFRVNDLDKEEVIVSVFEDEHDSNTNGFNVADHDEPGLFSGSGRLLGRVRIPVRSVASGENHTLSPTWFTLETTNNVAGDKHKSG